MKQMAQPELPGGLSTLNFWMTLRVSNDNLHARSIRVHSTGGFDGEKP